MRRFCLQLFIGFILTNTVAAERWGALHYKVQRFEVHITGCDPGARGELIIPREIDGFPVTKIANGAFQLRKLLTRVQIPDTVTSIDGSAFLSCTSLLSAIIPDTVKTIGGSVFHDCTSLTIVELPANLTVIPAGTFYACIGLKEFIIPEGVTEIGSVAFRGSGLEKISLPGTLKKIADNAFNGCESLKSISIPASVTSIESQAFAASDYLTQVRIPERFHSETMANSLGLISAWPNGFLLPDTDISGPEESLEIRLAPVITVKGIPGSVKTIDFADTANGPWNLWKVVVVASGGTSEVDLDAGARNRFYRIR